MENSIDVALCLLEMGQPSDGGYEYGGSVARNLQDEYENIRWEDSRPKPTWQELNDFWNNNQDRFIKYNLGN